MKARIKKSSISIVSILLALVLGIGTLGYLSKGFTDWNFKDWFNNNTIADNDEIFNDLPIDGDGNVLGDGVYDMPQNLIFRSPSLASAQSNGITLTATVKPVTATNKKVSWSVVFANPSSAWATGKTVTNYVTVTPTAVGSPTATVKCLTGFNEKINIIVSSVSDSSIKAECVVDYANRLTSVSLKVENSSETTFEFAPNKITTFNNFGYMFAFNMSQYASVYTFGEGTISESELDALVFTLYSFSGINQRWSMFRDDVQGSGGLNFTQSSGLPISAYSLGFADDAYLDEMPELNDEILEICNQVYRESKTDVTKSLFKLTYSVSCKYYTQTFTSYMNIGSDDYSLVSDIELGNGSIIF